MQRLIENLEITPVSMVTREEKMRQRLNISCVCKQDGHFYLEVVRGGESMGQRIPFGLVHGHNNVGILLPPPEKNQETDFYVYDDAGNLQAEWNMIWQVPRHWTIYGIDSSHTDIGLHNSPYIQRYNSSNLLEKAMALCNETSDRTEASRYRYAVEGTWFWNNYGADRGRDATEKIVKNFVRQGLITVGAATAGNHTQVYGLEEMCRSAYTRRRLSDEWKINSRTMTMVDNNGISWGLVIPYVDAGYQNIIFSPNHWNPLPSTIWACNTGVHKYTWNTDAGGGGARIDVRYDSALPMVFYWLGADGKSKLLVWSAIQYGSGGAPFGIDKGDGFHPLMMPRMENSTAETLAKLEKRYPYGIWMFPYYVDDEEPNLILSNYFQEWNKKWLFPQFRTLGDFDAVFDHLRENFDAQIPVLSGDITGGWYQHPVAAPDLLARKFEADRMLPTAEKWASLAAVFVPDYSYPETAFRRAWDALICNDEHSYGTSGYQGRRVYETWMQHRDWIELAERTAATEGDRALEALSAQIAVDEPSIVLFNPTLQSRREILEAKNGSEEMVRFLSPLIPPFGYLTIPQAGLSVPEMHTDNSEEPPVVENDFYRLAFAADGSLIEIFDKELKLELLDESAPYHANQFVYTNDNHASFVTPQTAKFIVRKDDLGIQVTAQMEEPVSGAFIEQKVFLPKHEKRIDIDNRLQHVRDLINNNRYHRYGYYAFPFLMKDAVQRVHLNGCVASPKVDQTGHGTETYMAAREWSCVENSCVGIALLQLDSQLIEFDRIHPDKTDYGMKNDGSAIYSYLFNDWLQMHSPGGSHMNFRFRYTIISYSGGFDTAGIPAIAERMTNPICCRNISKQTGTLPRKKSFISADKNNLRLLALKKAENGDGVIARFHESAGLTTENLELNISFAEQAEFIRCSVDERNIETFSGKASKLFPFSYLTLRINVPVKTISENTMPDNDVPAPIGSVYTGLIAEPCAACGEDAGHLYLLWGQNMEPDLFHYELYRGEEPGFPPNSDSFLATVEPGPFRVARYEDKGLKTHTTYYYRVRAVNHAGLKSRFSEEFHGITREEK